MTVNNTTVSRLGPACPATQSACRRHFPAATASLQALTGGSEAFVCLSAADLEDAGERPVVADCILSLQAWWQAQQADAAGLRASASWPRPSSAGGGPGGASVSPSGIPPAGATTPPPLRTPPSPVAPPHAGSPEFSFTPHAAAAVHRASGQQRQDGLEYLMRTCNHMLKSSMGGRLGRWAGEGRAWLPPWACKGDGMAKTEQSLH